MQQLGSIQPRIAIPSTVPPRDRSRGYAACAWADKHLALDLLPHQRLILKRGLATYADGSPVYRTVLVTMARQNSKSTTALALVLWSMAEGGVREVVGASTKLDSARYAFLRAVDAVATGSDELAGLFRAPRLSNGQEQLTSITGATYRPLAANRRSARGHSAALVVLDEIQDLSEEGWAALSKLTLAQPRGQRWCFGTAGSAQSEVLNRLRATALARTDPTLLWLDWSAPPGAELDDRDGWRAANPALGRLITESALASDMATDPPNTFRSEVLNQVVESLVELFDMPAWAATADPSGNLDALRGRVHAGIDVSIDRRHVTLAVAAMTADGRVRVETAGAWDSTLTARRELPTLLAKVRPRSLTCCPGTTLATLGPELRRARVRVATVPEIGEACGGLVELVASRQVLHPDDPLLTTHLTSSQPAPCGTGAIRFDGLAGSHVDASYAVALAVRAARAAPAGGLRVVEPRE